MEMAEISGFIKPIIPNEKRPPNAAGRIKKRGINNLR
jgi:hypothetical protein